MHEVLQRLLSVASRIRDMEPDTTAEMLFLIAILAFGLINVVLGYRLLRFWVMLFGFGLGALGAYLVLRELGAEGNSTYIAAMTGLGVFIGAIGFLIYRVGIFILGAGVGFGVSLYLLHPLSSAAFFLCVLIGLALGYLALRTSRWLIIILTSLAGGLMAGFCASKLLRFGGWYPYLAGLVLTAAGIAVQAFLNPKQEEEDEEEDEWEDVIRSDDG